MKTVEKRMEGAMKMREMIAMRKTRMTMKKRMRMVMRAMVVWKAGTIMTPSPQVCHHLMGP